MELREQIILTSKIMMWVSRFLSIKDLFLFGLFLVRYINEKHLADIIFSIAFLGLSILFLTLANKFKVQLIKLEAK